VSSGMLNLNLINLCPLRDTFDLIFVLVALGVFFKFYVSTVTFASNNKKHLKNVGPIRDCEPPHAHLPGVATGTVTRRLRIDVHDDNA